MSLIDVVAAGVISGKTQKKLQEKSEGFWNRLYDTTETIGRIQYGCAGRAGRHQQPCLLTNGTYYVTEINVPSRLIKKFQEGDRRWHSDNALPSLDNSFGSTLTALWCILGSYDHILVRLLRKVYPHWEHMISRDHYTKSAVRDWQHYDAAKKLVHWVMRKPSRLLKIFTFGQYWWVNYYLESGASIGDIPGLEPAR